MASVLELSVGASGKEPAAKVRDVKDPGLIPGSGRSPWSRKWQPTPPFLPGESRGQRSPVATVRGGHKELDTTEPTSHMQRIHIQVI